MNYFTLLAFLPFLAIIFFLIIKKVQASKVMMGTFFFTFVMLYSFWKSKIDILLFSSLKGLLMALEIFLIIISILLLFNLLKKEKKLDNIRDFIKSYTDDKTVIVILVGFFLVSFFEAIAGFGTPAAIAVPILVFLGISPITSVILCLVADSLAVSFGAFGTPVIMGLKSFATPSQISEITILISIITFALALIIPYIIVLIYTKSIGGTFKTSFKYLKLSVVAGGSFGLFHLLSGIYVGAVTTSVIASIGGFLTTLLYLRTTPFVKKNNKNIHTSILIKGFASYIFLVVLLVLSRIKSIGFGDLLKSISFGFNHEQSISFSFSLYSPGVLILFTFLLFASIYLIPLKTKRNVHSNKVAFIKLKDIFSKSFSQGKSALITLIFTLMFVQILIFSKSRFADSVLYLVAEVFSKTGLFYIVLSPLIGSFGSFVTGSATVSNIIFGSLQAGISDMSIYSKTLILSLQTIGAGAGNMIAIHNVIAACSLVGLKNHESEIISHNMKIVFMYCLIASSVGILLFIFY